VTPEQSHEVLLAFEKAHRTGLAIGFVWGMVTGILLATALALLFRACELYFR